MVRRPRIEPSVDRRLLRDSCLGALRPLGGPRPATVTSIMKSREHWERVHRHIAPAELSWFQREPTVSLDLIRRVATNLDAPIIDVGGGASTLVDGLLDAG